MRKNLSQETDKQGFFRICPFPLIANKNNFLAKSGKYILPAHNYKIHILFRAAQWNFGTNFIGPIWKERVLM